jgi:phosphopantothenoylcysteine decarboxylase
MNTMMWNHPITKSQIEVIQKWGVITINPISKKLLCGDTGIGAMEEVTVIVQNIERILSKKS